MKESAETQKICAKEARDAYGSSFLDRPDRSVEDLKGDDLKYHLLPPFGDDGSDDEDWLVPGSHPIDWYITRFRVLFRAILVQLYSCNGTGRYEHGYEY